MDGFGIAGLIILVTIGAIVAFAAIDKWHQRYAWRRAVRDAERLMRDWHGVEKGPDGKWRKL